MRHRRAVGLHEQVVDEIDAEVDVLQPREQLGAFRFCEAGPQEVDRVELAAAAGQAGAHVRREDLLPAVMALERRQMRGADEALGLVVEARAGGRGRKPLDQRPRDARETGRSLGQEVGDVRVVAAEELVAALAGERDLDVGSRELRDEVASAARTSRRTARRTRPRARGGAARRPD